MIYYLFIFLMSYMQDIRHWVCQVNMEFLTSFLVGILFYIYYNLDEKFRHYRMVMEFLLKTPMDSISLSNSSAIKMESNPFETAQ